MQKITFTILDKGGIMFSVQEKQYIASEIEKLLLSLKHPEMPDERPSFKLHVIGKASWSWADIVPNWEYEDKDPSINPWNEKARDAMKE